MAHSRPIRFAILIATLPAIVAAQARDASTLHADPVAAVVLGLAVILVAAKLAGHVAARIGQPAVLGELAAGVMLGSLDLAGLTWFTGVQQEPTIQVLASLGVIILLFEVGLESTVRDMLKVGLPSLLVAVLGVVAPFVLGWGVGWLLLPDRSVYVHAFLGAMLTATSVGVTARVLQDLGKSQSREARVILGAAVIDDVLGLIILAIISGLIAAVDGGGSLNRLAVGVGMIPRGEVGLIFANIGLGLTIVGQPVVDDAIFSAIVIMVMVTTMVTPSALKWSFARNRQNHAKA